MKSFFKNVLQNVGLLAPLRKIKAKYFTPRGIGSWNPLIPEQEFSGSVRRAVKKLLEVQETGSVGSYLEFGVSRGTSMSAVFHVLNEFSLNDVRLIGFDSFEGMPQGSEKEGWAPGLYHSTLNATTKYLQNKGVDMHRVQLIKGWFQDTLSPETKQQLNITKAGIIMIDCDIYSASKTALNFSIPLIKDHAVIIFDDWGWTEDSGIVGQKEAFEEVLQQYPYFTVLPLSNYIPQSRVFLLSRNDNE